MSRVLKWTVPINDRDCALPISGHVIPGAEFVHTNGPEVFIWSVEPSPAEVAEMVGDTEPPTRVFRVYGTGDEVPEGYVWRATTPRLGGLVWHCFEKVR